MVPAGVQAHVVFSESFLFPREWSCVAVRHTHQQMQETCSIMTQSTFVGREMQIRSSIPEGPARPNASD